MARIVLIAGPTASGKSAVALALAERLGGTIVNADSMQVYRGLGVLSAGPTPADAARVPHRLYGHVDPGEAYSVGRWLEEVAPLLGDNAGEGPLIFVGGTGLYFDALTSGIAAVPAIPASVRAGVRASALGRPAAALHAELASRDPAMAARLRPSDRQRILRALEVVAATGRSLLAWQEGEAPALVPAGDAVRVVLAIERAELHRRIAARFAAMMAGGALDEVAAFGARGLPPDLPAMKALGMPALLRHVRGETGREAAVAEAMRDTRRYARRQETWFRNRMADWPRAAPEDAAGQVLDALGAARRP